MYSLLSCLIAAFFIFTASAMAHKTFWDMKDEIAFYNQLEMPCCRYKKLFPNTITYLIQYFPDVNRELPTKIKTAKSWLIIQRYNRNSAFYQCFAVIKYPREWRILEWKLETTVMREAFQLVKKHDTEIQSERILPKEDRAQINKLFQDFLQNGNNIYDCSLENVSHPTVTFATWKQNNKFGRVGISTPWHYGWTKEQKYKDISDLLYRTNQFFGNYFPPPAL